MCTVQLNNNIYFDCMLCTKFTNSTLKQNNKNINNNSDRALGLSVNHLRSRPLIYARDVLF